MLTDPEAIKHVYTVNSDNYPRAMAAREFLRNLLGGDGLLSTEGETHHHQRKMLMPHFGFAKAREFIGIFARHARQLSQHLKHVADQGVAVDMHDCTSLICSAAGAHTRPWEQLMENPLYGPTFYGIIEGHRFSDTRNNGYNDPTRTWLLQSLMKRALVIGVMVEMVIFNVLWVTMALITAVDA
ncbi:hypothetical protein AC1031_017023 [Aphanomyces cochlioides]|nr:hypothetical protein AC1031_017023 [Aphanomyces cochlioides]